MLLLNGQNQGSVNAVHLVDVGALLKQQADPLNVAVFSSRK